MNLQLTGRHVEITPAIRDYVVSKLSRIERHFDHVIDVIVIMPREHALHVAVEDRAPLARGERGDRRGGGAAHARQRDDVVEPGWKDSAEALDDLLRGPMQVARTRVVAQPAPEREHVVQGRAG